MSLVVCAACSRHVREPTCPFCGAAVATAVAAPAPRVARAALLGAVALVASACSSAVYGGPPIDGGGPDATTKSDAAADAGPDAIATFYGGPPIDSGIPDAGTGD